jgi:hypothetical protein
VSALRATTSRQAIKQTWYSVGSYIPLVIRHSDIIFSTGQELAPGKIGGEQINDMLAPHESGQAWVDA